MFYCDIEDIVTMILDVVTFFIYCSVIMSHDVVSLSSYIEFKNLGSEIKKNFSRTLSYAGGGGEVWNTKNSQTYFLNGP